MKKQIKIIAGSYLPDFEKECNLFISSLQDDNIIDTQLVVIMGCFYLKISYYG
jgi:hypothetical protein